MKKNDVETTVDSDEILWLNEKYVEEELAFNLRVITVNILRIIENIDMN